MITEIYLKIKTPPSFSLRFQINRFSVKHGGLFEEDGDSLSLDFERALDQLRKWSDNFPAHHPIIIHIDVKPCLCPSSDHSSKKSKKSVQPSAIEGNHLGFEPCTCFGSSEEFGDQLDRIFARAFGAKKMLVPIDLYRQQLNSSSASLEQAINSFGWPKLSELQGKFIAVLSGFDEDDQVCRRRYHYSKRHRSGGNSSFAFVDIDSRMLQKPYLWLQTLSSRHPKLFASIVQDSCNLDRSNPSPSSESISACVCRWFFEKNHRIVPRDKIEEALRSIDSSLSKQELSSATTNVVDMIEKKIRSEIPKKYMSDGDRIFFNQQLTRKFPQLWMELANCTKSSKHFMSRVWTANTRQEIYDATNKAQANIISTDHIDKEIKL